MPSKNADKMTSGQTQKSLFDFHEGWYEKQAGDMSGNYKISSKDRKRAHRILDKMIDLHNSFDTWSMLRYSKNILIQVGAQLKVSLYRNSARKRNSYLSGHLISNLRSEHISEFGPRDFKTLKDATARADELRGLSKHEDAHEAKTEIRNNSEYILRALRTQVTGFERLVNSHKYIEYPEDTDESEDGEDVDYEEDEAFDEDEYDEDEYLYKLRNKPTREENEAIMAKRALEAETKAKTESERAARIEARRGINPGVRYNILTRDKFKCVLCGRSSKADPKLQLCVDHIIPVVKGGTSELKNLRTLCSDCNMGKLAKLPPVEHVKHSKKLKQQLRKLKKQQTNGT